MGFINCPNCGETTADFYVEACGGCETDYCEDCANINKQKYGIMKDEPISLFCYKCFDDEDFLEYIKDILYPNENILSKFSEYLVKKDEEMILKDKMERPRTLERYIDDYKKSIERLQKCLKSYEDELTNINNK